MGFWKDVERWPSRWVAEGEPPITFRVGTGLFGTSPVPVLGSVVVRFGRTEAPPSLLFSKSVEESTADEFAKRVVPIDLNRVTQIQFMISQAGQGGCL